MGIGCLTGPSNGYQLRREADETPSGGRADCRPTARFARWARTILRSFQPTDQAIDSYQNSESEMHPHRSNKHQDPYLDTHNSCYQQRNDHAGEANERNNDAKEKLWRLILRYGPRGL